MKSIVDYPDLVELYNLPSDLVEEALTHPSFKSESPNAPDYERLETLGDAVLDLVVADDLFRRIPFLLPGQMTKKRAAMVRNSTLSKLALDLGLENYLRVAPQYTISNSDRANMVEALFGAVYYHAGYVAAQQLYQKIKPLVDQIIATEKIVNPIGMLQEIAQKHKIPLPEYSYTKRGPDHDPEFQCRVELEVNGVRFSITSGGDSKASSKATAATDLLYLIQEKEPDIL